MNVDDLSETSVNARSSGRGFAAQLAHLMKRNEVTENILPLTSEK